MVKALKVYGLGKLAKGYKISVIHAEVLEIYCTTQSPELVTMYCITLKILSEINPHEES